MPAAEGYDEDGLREVASVKKSEAIRRTKEAGLQGSRRAKQDVRVEKK